MARDRKDDSQARDSAVDVDAKSAVSEQDQAQAAAAADAQRQAEVDAQRKIEESAAVPAEVQEASDEEKDAAAQDPLNADAQIVVVEEFRSEDGSPITVSIAGLQEKFPADGSVIDVTERQARLYEESPAIARVEQPDEEDDA
jgi:hypothetical protein